MKEKRKLRVLCNETRAPRIALNLFFCYTVRLLSGFPFSLDLSDILITYYMLGYQGTCVLDFGIRTIQAMHSTLDFQETN